MKKKLFIASAFVFILCAFTSCENSCKTCRQVTYINNSYDHEDPAQEYCGVALAAIEATKDITNGNSTIKWECN
jgi:hypothetical protein